MFSLHGPSVHPADIVSRREMLRLGGLSFGGLSLAALLENESRGATASKPGASKSASSSFGKAKRCIMLYLSGGPPQHDMWDPKPDAPSEIRGEFDTIATSLPGTRFGEHLPLTAPLMHK